MVIRALLVGINYTGKFGFKSIIDPPNTPARWVKSTNSVELTGCIADVNNMKTYLKNIIGISENNITLLTDDSTDPLKIPTCKNIKDNMASLVKDVAAGDSLFFYYSGHGALIADTNDDETDNNNNKDSYIIPVDYFDASAPDVKLLIIDDDLKKMLINPIPSGANLTVVFDCSHSGTGGDLKYVYTENTIVDTSTSVNTKIQSDTTNKLERIEKYSKDIKQDCITMNYLETAGNVVVISGCRDNQNVDDDKERDDGGALSINLLKILKSTTFNYARDKVSIGNGKFTITWSELFYRLRYLMIKYNQKIQLSFGRSTTLSSNTTLCLNTYTNLTSMRLSDSDSEISMHVPVPVPLHVHVPVPVPDIILTPTVRPRLTTRTLLPNPIVVPPSRPTTRTLLPNPTVVPTTRTLLSNPTVVPTTRTLLSSPPVPVPVIILTPIVRPRVTRMFIHL